MADLILLLRQNGHTIAVAETCTGGLISAALVAPAGASAYYLGGVIAYDDAVKIALLGIPPDVIATYGSVSAEVALALAHAVRERLGSTLGLGVSGLAGPVAGRRSAKPAGLVYIALATSAHSTYRVYRWPAPASRAENQQRSTDAALALIADYVRLP